MDRNLTHSLRVTSIMSLRVSYGSRHVSLEKTEERRPKCDRRRRRRVVLGLDDLEVRVVPTVYGTSLALTESAAVGVFGQSVTFTATVTSSNGVPTGSVIFEDGASSVWSVSLSSGVASLTTSTLAAGAHSMTAFYSGAVGAYYPSASAGPSQSNLINTTAGNGTGGNTGDGGQATSAELWAPGGIAFDSSGDLFIADALNNVIREVTQAGVISTVAGNGTAGYGGDGGPATSAELNDPTSVALDAHGNLFIADSSNNVIREVNASGVITTVAGNQTSGYSGDGGPAASAELALPFGVSFDAHGNMFIADTNNNVIREVNPSGAIITVAGNHIAGYSGDGGPATAAELDNPRRVLFDAAGDMFIADTHNNVVREVTPSGVISTAVGNHTQGYSGDGGPAASAELDQPVVLVFDSFGDLFITDVGNNVVREATPAGIIITAAGGGSDVLVNGVPVGATSLGAVRGLAFDPSGNLLIADTSQNTIRDLTVPPSQPLTYTVRWATTVSLVVTVGSQGGSFRATVSTSSGFLVNGGVVSFYEGPTLFGVAPVVNGAAVFPYSSLSPGEHTLSALFSGTELDASSLATETVTVGSPSVTGLSRYPVHNNRTLVSLFFDQTLNPAEAIWKHNYKLHTSSGGNIKISYIYFDSSADTVTLLPGRKLALWSTYNLKLLGLNSKSGSKGSTPTVSSTGWLATNFKAKINHHALSARGAPPAITVVNGQEVATRG